MVYIWFIHRFRYSCSIHIHQNACWKSTQILNTPWVFLREATVHIRHCGAVIFFMLSVTCGSPGRYQMVVESLNFFQLDMWVNFMPDSLFTRKQLCLRNYYEIFEMTRVFPYDRLGRTSDIKTKNTPTAMKVINSLKSQGWKSHEWSSVPFLFYYLVKWTVPWEEHRICWLLEVWK